MSVTRSGPARAPVAAPSGRDDPTSLSRGRGITPEAIGVAVLIGAGVALRFLTVSDLWLDEALSVNIAALPLDQLPDALRQDGHPPLYYALLHGWMSLFGEGDVAVRALAGVFSVASLVLVWIAGRRLGGRRMAWIATLFLAVLPYTVRYGSETRMYSLVMMLVLAGYLLVGDSLRRPVAWRLVAIAFVSGLLLLSHYWALWLAAATLLMLAWRAYRAGEGAVRRSTLLTAGAVAAGGLLFVPWLPVFFDQMSSTGTPWATPSRPTTMVAVSIGDLGGGAGAQLPDADLLGAAFLILVLLGVFGRVLDRRRIEIDIGTVPRVRDEALIVVLTVTIGAAASWIGSTAFASRYVAVVIPLVVLIAAVGASQFTGRLAGAVVIGGVSVLALGLATYWGTVNRTQAGEIAEFIEAEGQPGDLVVACPDQLGPSIGRLLPDGFDVVSYPELGPADRVDWRDYQARHAVDPAAVAEAILERAGDRSIWVVSSPSYRVVDDQCDAMRDQLAAVRPSATVVTEQGDEFFEHASLTEFPAS